MPNSENSVTGLTIDGCRLRQQRLVDQLQRKRIERALICDPRHVYYLTGYLTASYHASLFLLAADGTSHLVLPATVETSAFVATESSVYESHRLGTLVEDQFRASMRPIERELASVQCLATDATQFAILRDCPILDISADLAALRRCKTLDEIDVLRHAIRACEAGYSRAAEILRPGLREVDVYAAVQAAAIEELGEPIGELGNDFQSGTSGGPPRIRPIEHGELMPLDVSVSARGYHSDLCRTFAIGNEPTKRQRDAFDLVHEALRYAEQHVQPGASCRQLYEQVKDQLHGVNGWQFPHHLGHGIGLGKHEDPRLNPGWDHKFETGDVFTLEPGLYHEELRGGVRIEQNYWLSPDGLVRLSSYPIAL